jgi:hypothetical protein
MILIKTTAPQLVDATALHTNTFTQKNTNLCSFNNALSADYALSFNNKTFEESANHVNALRNYMQNVVLSGPQLDAQTLQMHVDRILSLPPQMVQPLVREIGDAFAAANQRRASDDDSFIGKLAKLLNQCGGPCNYFRPIGDTVALLANSAQQNTNNVAPAWDGSCSLCHAPLNIAGVTFNKISLAAQQILASVCTATKNIVAKATDPLFDNRRKTTETSLMQQGKCMSFTAHGSYLATDPFPYFQTQNNASNLLARARGSLNDCFRLHEFKYRYNPLDPNMNQAVATNATINVASEGCNYALNVFGKDKTPITKPEYLSIKGFLDYKESNYDWDDAENWTTNPKTGKKETEPNGNSSTDAQQNSKANAAGSKVTDYGQANDPDRDPNTMKGIGILGIGEGKGPAGLKGGNYLLKDYSMAVSPDVETQMRASGIKPGDWVQVQTVDGRAFNKRWDARTSDALTGRVNFYSPVGRASELDSRVTTITKTNGPPAGYIQPPRYVYGEPADHN